MWWITNKTHHRQNVVAEVVSRVLIATAEDSFGEAARLELAEALSFAAGALVDVVVVAGGRLVRALGIAVRLSQRRSGSASTQSDHTFPYVAATAPVGRAFEVSRSRATGTVAFALHILVALFGLRLRISAAESKT